MKLFQMLLSERNVLENYTCSPHITENILQLFCDTLPLYLDEEGDRNAQLGIQYCLSLVAFLAHVTLQIVFWKKNAWRIA